MSAAPVYLLEENHDLPLCRLQVTVRVGAAEDPGGEGRDLAGLCNFATELMRRGAGGRTRTELDAALDHLGASLTVSAGRESVTFDLLALREKLEEASALLADVILRPDFSAEEAGKLRRELRAHLDDLRDDDSALCSRFFYRGIYGQHPLGRPIEGTAESLERLTVEDARSWHRQNLHTGTVVFGAAGDLTERELLSLCERHFRDLPTGPRPSPTLPEPTPLSGMHLHLVDKPERTQSQILIGQLAPRWNEPHWLPLRVAATAFGGTFTARLMDEVRTRRGLSYGASARTGAGRGRPLLVVHVFPSAEQTAETLELVLRLYREWAEGGLRPEEVEFAREYLARSFAFRIETPEARLNLRTEVELAGLQADYIARFPGWVRSITPAQVDEALRAQLRPRDLLVTLVCTANALREQLQTVQALHGAVVETFSFDSF
ncbi:MAG: pitrilysin family protein [Myxococcales bacterium]|nr:insulinase family protein [Myxococcota bacterium]MDW8282161.1 pitrilysin family protein [Myxococcales bacterium]